MEYINAGLLSILMFSPFLFFSPSIFDNRLKPMYELHIRAQYPSIRVDPIHKFNSLPVASKSIFNFYVVSHNMQCYVHNANELTVREHLQLAKQYKDSYCNDSDSLFPPIPMSQGELFIYWRALSNKKQDHYVQFALTEEKNGFDQLGFIKMSEFNFVNYEVLVINQPKQNQQKKFSFTIQLAPFLKSLLNDSFDGGLFLHPLNSKEMHVTYENAHTLHSIIASIGGFFGIFLLVIYWHNMFICIKSWPTLRKLQLVLIMHLITILYNVSFGEK